MKIIIKPNKDRMYFSTKDAVVGFITGIVAREGYTINSKNDSYKVENIKQIDQDKIKKLVVSECEQIGLEYEIIV